MNDRENDNRIKDEGRQVQQELEDQLRAFGDTMTDAFRNGFEGRGMEIGDRAYDIGKAAVHAANYGIGEAAKAFRQGRAGSGTTTHDAAGMPGWFRQIFAKPEPTPVENIRISAKKRYSNGCTLLAVGITFAVIFGLGGIGCIVASDALLPDLITETMIGDTVATAAEDKGRRGVRQHIEVGFDLGGEAVVNLPSQRRVAVQLLAAAQEPHPFGQEFADPLVAAIDVNLVDSFDLGQRSEYVAHERRPAQRTQVLAADALAVEPYGDECCCFHNSVLYRGLPALRRKPV